MDYEKKDEKFRKELLESFKYQQRESRTDKEWLNGIKLSEVVAWLEKQGEKEHKFIIGDVISNNNAIYRVDNIVKNCIGQDCYFLVNVQSEKDGTRYLKLFDSNGKTHNSGEITWLCEQVDAKFEKQETISDKCRKEAGFNWDAKEKILRRFIRTIKSNDENAQSIWSDEDEYMLNETIQHLEELIIIDKTKHCGVDVQYYQRDIDWLKSLKERLQAQWNPSEEQLNALDEIYKTHGANSVCRRIIFNLLEQLKKL